jgi:hypothetical protein
VQTSGDRNGIVALIRPAWPPKGSRLADQVDLCLLEGPHALAVVIGAVKGGEPSGKTPKPEPDASKFEISRQAVADTIHRGYEIVEA